MAKKKKRIVLVSEDREENDYYPTDPYALEALLLHEKFPGTISEPACGAGDLSIVFQNKGRQVYSTDLVDRGFGICNMDFLNYEGQTFDNIITNPPYKHSLKFILKAKKHATKKIALLLPIKFLESQKRYSMFQDMEFAFKTVYQFSERISLYKNGIKTKNSGTVAYAWFVWEKGYTGAPTIKWIKPKTRIMIIEKHVKQLSTLSINLKNNTITTI